MPVILAPAHQQVWLATEDPGLLAGLMGPGGSVELAARAVSRHVNDPRHDDADCLAPENQLPR